LTNANILNKIVEGPTKSSRINNAKIHLKNTKHNFTPKRLGKNYKTYFEHLSQPTTITSIQEKENTVEIKEIYDFLERLGVKGLFADSGHVVDFVDNNKENIKQYLTASQIVDSSGTMDRKRETPTNVDALFIRNPIKNGLTSNNSEVNGDYIFHYQGGVVENTNIFAVYVGIPNNAKEKKPVNENLMLFDKGIIDTCIFVVERQDKDNVTKKPRKFMNRLIISGKKTPFYREGYNKPEKTYDYDERDGTMLFYNTATGVTLRELVKIYDGEAFKNKAGKDNLDVLYDWKRFGDSFQGETTLIYGKLDFRCFYFVNDSTSVQLNKERGANIVFKKSPSGEKYQVYTDIQGVKNIENRMKSEARRLRTIRNAMRTGLPARSQEMREQIMTVLRTVPGYSQLDSSGIRKLFSKKPGNSLSKSTRGRGGSTNQSYQSGVGSGTAQKPQRTRKRGTNIENRRIVKRTKASKTRGG
jgi:hypothetical protein